MKLELSGLPKTWLIDVDGTIVKHNGYKNDGDVLLEGVQEFFAQIDEQDVVILLTARNELFRQSTEDFLKANNIRYDKIIFGLPTGERILINDDKPSGLKMGHAINKTRDCNVSLFIKINKDL